MKLPALLCGTRKDVQSIRAQLSKLLREVSAGEDFVARLNANLVDHHELSGSLVLETRVLLGLDDNAVHYWCDIPMVVVGAKLDDEPARLKELCSALFQQEWGGLTFLSQESNGVERRVPGFDEEYGRWILRFVERVDVGRRFWAGLGPRFLWEMGTGLTGVLGALGASNDELLTVKSLAEYKKLAERLLRATREDS